MANPITSNMEKLVQNFLDIAGATVEEFEWIKFTVVYIESINKELYEITAKSKLGQEYKDYADINTCEIL